MITVKMGDLLNEVKSGNIIHGCNAQGVMGSGFAKQVKETYPKAYQFYRATHNSRGLMVGDAYPVKINDDLIIWNLITQEFYGVYHKQFEYGLLTSAFKDMILKEIKGEIYMPLIGCGLGKGKIELAIPIIRDIIDAHGLNATIYVQDEPTLILVNELL